MEQQTKVRYLSVDTGGTFTDYLVQFTDQSTDTGKVSSTPSDPSRSIQKILNRFNLSDRIYFVHGTTVATNALLEDDLVDVLVVTNEGLGGLLKIGRGERKELNNLNPDPEQYPFQDTPVVEVPLRQHPFLNNNPSFSETERLSLKEKVEKQDPDIVAVCLVHSYGDSSGETSIRSALEPLDIPVVLSSDVLPRFREFERASTTVLNAGLRPIISNYLDKIDLEQTAEKKFNVMSSDRGTMSKQEAIERPVKTVLSGPTGGLFGARQLVDNPNDGFITMDIGGTSTDVCLMENGQVPLKVDHEIGKYPMGQPVADIHTIGSGGGSIIRVDEGEHLRVGPRSAGANPGPACYGSGGPPTVTDAHVLLGRIPTDRPISDSLELSLKKAEKSLEKVGSKIDLSSREVSSGALRIVQSQLSEALRSVTVERGHHPKNYPLVAYGGGGGLYAAKVAEQLGIKRVYIPRKAGIGSAMGLLNAPRCYRRSVSPLQQLSTSEDSLPRLEELVSRKPNWSNEADQIKLEAECQFVGQTHTIPISVSRNTTQGNLVNRFKKSYKSTFNYLPDQPGVELVHLSGEWYKKSLFTGSYGLSEPNNSQAELTHTSAFIENDWKEIPMKNLETVDNSMRGPALLSGRTTTVFMPKNWLLEPQTEVVILRSHG